MFFSSIHDLEQLNKSLKKKIDLLYLIHDLESNNSLEKKKRKRRKTTERNRNEEEKKDRSTNLVYLKNG